MARGAGANELQTSIRLSQELYGRIDAAREGRPLGEEIRRRLIASFAAEPAPPATDDPWFGDLLAAVNHAAVDIARTYPLPRKDDAAFTTMRDVILMLILVVRPEAVEHANVPLATSGVIAGRALSSLGERGDPLFPRLLSVLGEDGGQAVIEAMISKKGQP